MAIADYKAETREIKFKGGSFLVKGLTFEAITELIRRHLGDIDGLFDHINNKFGDVSNIRSDMLGSLATAALAKAPDLLNEVIVLAAVEDTKIEDVRKLPFPIRLLTVIDIGKLTFEEVGGVGKFMAEMGPLFAGLMTDDKQKAVVQELRQALVGRPSSTKVSAAM